MTTEPTHDLLGEVRRYLESVSKEQVIADMQGSGFEAYNGIGERIFPDATSMHVEVTAAELYTSNFVRTDMIMPVPTLPMKLFATQSAGYTMIASTCETAGTHEEMPLAA